jgi:alcohol dehydrogenase (cytochrome c)
MLNRETGQPLHSIVETAMPTTTDVPGEQVWPTQPVPHKANGRPMEPFVPTFPMNIPASVTAQPSAYLTPPRITNPVVHAPGILGGTNFAPLSMSQQTGLIYVVGIDQPWIFTVQPVGATLQPGQFSIGGSIVPARAGRSLVTAYDPATGELVWQSALPGVQQAGTVVTGGDLVFVGSPTGFLYALDARTGEQVWRYNTGGSAKSSPMVYQLNGKQYISLNSGNAVLTFGLLSQ